MGVPGNRQDSSLAETHLENTLVPACLFLSKPFDITMHYNFM